MSGSGLVIMYMETKKTSHECTTVYILRGATGIYVDISNTIIRFPRPKSAPEYLKVTRSVRRFTYHKDEMDEVIATDEIFNYILNEMETIPRLYRDLYNILYDTMRMAILEYLDKGTVREREVVIRDVYRIKVGSEEVLKEVDKDKLIELAKKALGGLHEILGRI